MALGAALSLLGDFDLGIAHMRHGIKLSPRDPSYQQMLEEIKKQAEGK